MKSAARPCAAPGQHRFCINSSRMLVLTLSPVAKIRFSEGVGRQPGPRNEERSRYPLSHRDGEESTSILATGILQMRSHGVTAPCSDPA